MNRFLVLIALAPVCLGANLAYSTFLRDGFTPSALASDAQGNVYVTGSVILDPASPQTSVMVAKLDPTGSKYLYLTYVDSAASDTAAGIAVDSAGNAYICGWTNNPNFSATGGTLGTASSGIGFDPRSFLTKLSPDGAIVFSTLLGGSTASTAKGIALTAQGQILVSGTTAGGAFQATPGAYSGATKTDTWFLMELDPAATKVIFLATGIGGSSLVTDAAGNIYMAGSSPGTDYPTTPGAYQTKVVQGFICYPLCQIGFLGELQHVTKVDSAASTLLYSTGLNDLKGGAGSTTNTGLAVDASGNAYVTGTLLEAVYPFTVPAPGNVVGFLTKLDPTGASALFSIPVGGAGVQLDSSGALYTGGVVSTYSPLAFAEHIATQAPPSVFTWVPQACWANNITAVNGAYILKVDAVTGTLLDGQWIDGSAPGATSIAAGGGKVWITGFTPFPDVPYTPGALASAHILPGPLAGGYLAAADFSQAPAGPSIACVLDQGNWMHVGAVTSFQLIALMGQNLGPAAGVIATDGMDTSIAGVSVTFDGQPAQLFYVSASQINVVVPEPLPSQVIGPLPSSTVMRLTVNGVTTQRQFPFTATNLNLFVDLASLATACGAGTGVLATNADGTLNSCAHPAKFGSIVSLYASGVGATSIGFPPVQQILDLQAQVGRCSAAVEQATLIGNFVYRIDVRLPSALLPCATSYSLSAAVNYFDVTLSRGGLPLGPFQLPQNPSLPYPAYPRPLPVAVTQ